VFRSLLLCLLLIAGEGKAVANTFDSGHVIIPVLHPSGEVHNLAAPENTPLADLHDSLVSAGYVQPKLGSQPLPTAAGAIENSDQFRARSGEAWKAAGQGSYPLTESGFAMDAQGNASPLRTQTTPPTPGGTTVDHDRITYKTSDTGVVHTHPNNSIPGPSQNDIKAAKKIGKTIYTVSQGGLYSINGKTGEVTHVFKSPSWMSDKNPK
jgi:hypothetical protein